MLYVNYTSLFFKDFICLFLDRGEGREEEGEKHQCVVANVWLSVPPMGGLACNPGTCASWESNCGSSEGTQSTEPPARATPHF